MEFYAEKHLFKKNIPFLLKVSVKLKKKYYVCTMQVKNTYIIFNV